MIIQESLSTNEHPATSTLKLKSNSDTPPSDEPNNFDQNVNKPQTIFVDRAYSRTFPLSINADTFSNDSWFKEENESLEDEGIIASANDEDIIEESDESECCNPYDSTCRKEVRQVTLTRTEQYGLGISVAGGSQTSSPVIINAIHPASPADLCKSIFIGDQILSVNGVQIDENTSHNDIVRLLSECGDTVCLGKLTI